MQAPSSRLPLDTTVLVATPENVAFDFRLAGPFQRCGALLVDIILMTVVVIALAFLLALLGWAGIGLLLFIGFVIWWGYGGLMEAFSNGQTIGKKALGIKVVSDSGLAINAGQAFLRNVIRSADLFPPFFPGVACMLFGLRMQRLGDLAAGTMVVLDNQRVSPRPPWTRSCLNEIREQIPSRYRPDAALVEGLAAYVGRRAELSAARRRELSQILARHFIRVWSLPARTDPDQILCAVYEHATTNQEFWETRNQPFGPIVKGRPQQATDAFVVPEFMKEARP